MKDMHVFERDVNGRRYRIAAQSVWNPVRGRSVARQIVLRPATAAPVADLGGRATRSDRTHRPGVRQPWCQRRSVGRRVGRGGSHPAGVLTRTEAGLGGLSGWGCAALVVSAFFGL